VAIFSCDPTQWSLRWQGNLAQIRRLCHVHAVAPGKTFERRGIVEGFFGPLWSMAHRRRLFEFGTARRMNTYLYAPVLSRERIPEEKRQ